MVVARKVVSSQSGHHVFGQNVDMSRCLIVGWGKSPDVKATSGAPGTRLIIVCGWGRRRD